MMVRSAGRVKLSAEPWAEGARPLRRQRDQRGRITAEDVVLVLGFTWKDTQQVTEALGAGATHQSVGAALRWLHQAGRAERRTSDHNRALYRLRPSRPPGRTRAQAAGNAGATAGAGDA